MSEPQKEFMTYREFATRMGVCVATVKKWRKQKRFAIEKIGYRTVRIAISEYHAFLDRNKLIAVKGR